MDSTFSVGWRCPDHSERQQGRFALRRLSPALGVQPRPCRLERVAQVVNGMNDRGLLCLERDWVSQVDNVRLSLAMPARCCCPQGRS